MKLVHFGDPCEEKPGLVDADGAIRDLSAHVADFAGSSLSPASLGKLRAIDPASLPLTPAGVRLRAPVAGTRNFVAVGLNFADHAKEMGQTILSLCLIQKGRSGQPGRCEAIALTEGPSGTTDTPDNQLARFEQTNVAPEQLG